MSLFFKERSDEQIENPATDKITFIHPWIIEIPRTFQMTDYILFRGHLRTTYNAFSEYWSCCLSRNSFVITPSSDENDEMDDPIGPCFISYKLFYDTEMRFEYHSSKRVYAIWSNSTSFTAPDGFLTKIYDAIEERKISKIVIFMEMVLPKKYFSYPYDNPSSWLSLGKCKGYPNDMETNFRFQFLKQSDYTIQCPDGTMPALRSSLNLSSIFMQEHFEKFQDDKLIVQDSVDVIKPLVMYLHSFCFEMPQSFTLDFADRLLKAIQDFGVFREQDILASIQLSLCQKFVEETMNFDTLLRWLSFAYQHSLTYLKNMIQVVIATKFYYKWHETFPENARNVQNPMYRDIFGLIGFNTSETFRSIDGIFNDSLFTTAILH